MLVGGGSAHQLMPACLPARTPPACRNPRHDDHEPIPLGARGGGRLSNASRTALLGLEGTPGLPTRPRVCLACTLGAPPCRRLHSRRPGRAAALPPALAGRPGDARPHAHARRGAAQHWCAWGAASPGGVGLGHAAGGEQRPAGAAKGIACCCCCRSICLLLTLGAQQLVRNTNATPRPTARRPPVLCASETGGRRRHPVGRRHRAPHVSRCGRCGLRCRAGKQAMRRTAGRAVPLP